MEPMNLGSPPSSPASPNPNFLPAYLMGESQQITSPSNPAISPGRNKTPLMMKTGTQQQYSNNIRQKLFNQSTLSDFNSPITSPFGSPAVEKAGPPKTGLFDVAEKANTPVLSSTMRHPAPNEQIMFGMNDSTMFDTIDGSFRQSAGAPANFNDSFNNYLNYSQMDARSVSMNMGRQINQINTLWVTVFGFVPSSTSLIIAQMSNCGTIQEKKYPTQGNWIHLKYCSAQEVAKALLLNGKLISNSIMIGVVPYYNKCEMDKENNMSGAQYSSPIIARSQARSLRTSNVPQLNSNTVVSPQNVPQKSTGLVTKAMEYVFGW